MKKKYFMALLLLMAFLQKSAAQVSEKDRDMFVEYYSEKYNPESLRQLLSKPANASVLRSCIRNIKDIKARKDIKDNIEEGGPGKDANLEGIYRNLGIKIGDDYSRKLMPGFDITAYQAFNNRESYFKIPELAPGSHLLYQIDMNTYRGLINAYSKIKQTGLFPKNAYDALIFDEPELLESLKNKIKGMAKDLEPNYSHTLDMVAGYWLESSYYYKIKQDVLTQLKKDITNDQKNMSLCNNLLAELNPKPADEKDSEELLFEKITNKKKVTVIPADNKNTGNNPPKNEEKKTNPPSSPGWSGTYEDRNKLTTIIISGSSAFYTGTFSYEVDDSKGTGGNLDECKVTGNKMTGEWKVTHEDKTKKGQREGTFEIELTADGIKGAMKETKEPMWQYKEGYSKENVISSMGKGKSFTIDSVRK